MSIQKSCLTCGTLIPTDSPGELCAPCLFAPALERDSRTEPTESTDLTPILDRPATPFVVKFHSFGDYQLLAEIARGGMGVVFRARQVSLDRIVALKFIHPEKLDSPEAAHRFRIEAQAAAGLNHPNIVTIHSVGQRDGVHFLSMELVEGRPLSQLIPPGGFALAKFLELGIPLTDALAAAHARGIGHRDLKPSNVMLSDQGRIKVIDFGLAKRLRIGTGPGDAGHKASHPTRTGQVLGTTAYMAPEQLEGREADHRSDIFSLGILLFEMATGRRPFTGDSAVAVMSSILRDAPLEPAQLNPSLPEPLCQILDRCLQKAPADRYQSALEIRDELKGLQNAAGIGPNPGLLTTAEMIPGPADSPLAGRTRSGRRSNGPGPGNLPAPLTSFIGRERETIEVAKLIGNDPESVPAAIRLLTLTGPGGTGKTRLALQVAARVTDVFPDGVWLVELAALSDATLVTQTVGTAQGLLNTSGGPPLEPLTRFLSPKRSLLILDNCEHLVSACADLAGELLRHCPKLQILATSREGLRLGGETTWPVPSLSTPTTSVGRLGRIPLEELAQYESIRLFVERARATAPAFDLDERNATAVAELCRRLDGIPLAIELAAARTRLLPVEVLLERVQDRFRLFTGGSRTALPRQQTLRAMVDWSYDLLSAPERLLFDRLSVFAGGWTLEAAEAICGDSTVEPENDQTTPLEAIRVVDILELLGRLLEKSMVLAELSTGGKARYHLLETLRQYGQERLAARGASATAAMQTRHATHFAQMGEEAAAAMHGPNQASWIERLEIEHDNLRAGLEWGKSDNATTDRVELGLRLAAPLYLPWLRQGHGREGRHHFETLLAHRNGQRPTRARAQVLFAVGSFALWQDGEEGKAWTILNESLALGERLGDSQVMAEARHNLGVVLSNRGDIAGARRQHEEALKLTRADNDISGIRWSLEDLADLADEEGATEHAASLRDEALTLARQSGDYHGIASILQTMGTLARAAGQIARARQLISEGFELMQRIGCQHCSARYLGDLAIVIHASGETERAVRLLGASEALRERTGIVTPSVRLSSLEKALEEARPVLGEAGFADAWGEGFAMSLTEATACALG